MIKETEFPVLPLGMIQVAKWVAENGIDKDKKSKADGQYKYRGIDKVLNDISMPLAKAGITVAPSYRVIEQRPHLGKDGKPNGVISLVEGSVTFYDAVGNSRTIGPVPGEAYDNMDKSYSKACSVAYRNLMLLTFVAPLGPMSPDSTQGYDPEDEGDSKTEAAQDAEPERAEEPGGIFLKGAQLKWLEAKMSGANISEAAVLKKFHRVDASNAKDVGAWIDGA